MSRGAPKVPLTYAGAWDNTRTYLPREVATEDGGPYMALALNTGVTPSSDPLTWLPLGSGAPAARMAVHASQLVTDGMLGTKASLTELEAPSSGALELAPPSGGAFFNYDRVLLNTAGIWTFTALWHLDTDLGATASIALELLTSIAPSPIATLRSTGSQTRGFLTFAYYFPAGGSCGLQLNDNQFDGTLPDVTVDVDLYVSGPT